MAKIKIQTGIKTMSNEIIKRLKKTQPMIVELAFAFTKAEANRFIGNFKSGIRMNNFKLQSLEPTTVVNKQNEGMSKPNIPLYGKGDEKTNDSYINMLRVRKLKNGWKVFPSWKKHWKSKLALRDLFEVHEFGALFTNSGGTVTRIPPRPAFLKAKLRTLSQAKKQVAKPEIRKALNRIMKQNKTDTYRKIFNKFNRQSDNILQE